MARMGEERKVYKVLVGKLQERYHSEDRGVDRSKGSEWIYWLGALEWIKVAHDMDRWRALVKKVMNLRGFGATELVS
jgi:hypothetical protein